MLPVYYASTVNIGVLDGQYLILLLMLKHSGMANTKIKNVVKFRYQRKVPKLILVLGLHNFTHRNIPATQRLGTFPLSDL